MTRVTDHLGIAPSGNVTDVCGHVSERAQKGEIVLPKGGYTRGGEKHDPKVNGAREEGTAAPVRLSSRRRSRKFGAQPL